MAAVSPARKRANDIAKKYIGDCKDWSTSKLVNRLEVTAYTLARNGQTKEAASLFIVVADLIKLGKK